jgi:hypothetical protein
MSINKIVCAALSSAVILAAGYAWAAEPKDITFKGKGSKLMGGEYMEYTVHCSDGKSRTITAWDKRKKWCVGTSDECTNDQLKAAKMACK